MRTDNKTTNDGQRPVSAPAATGAAAEAAKRCLALAEPRCVLTRIFPDAGDPAASVLHCAAARDYLAKSGAAYLAALTVLPEKGLRLSDLPPDLPEDLFLSALRGVLEVYADEIAADLSASAGKETAAPLFLTEELCGFGALPPLLRTADPGNNLRLPENGDPRLLLRGAAVALIGVTDRPAQSGCGRCAKSGPCAACPVRKKTEK